MQTSTSAPQFIEIKGLCQKFQNKMILNDIGLSLQQGEFLSVVGPSGGGKSSFLRIMIGQDNPVSGQVRIDGETMGGPDGSRGVVYQNYSLFPHLSVVENVMIGEKISVPPWRWHKRSGSAKEKAMSLLERTGMADHCNKLPYQLSGGQRQRVAIAQALSGKPKLLCMDEPFSALDPGTRENMQLLTLELWEELGLTIFFVTHDLEEAIYLGTRLVALSPYYTVDGEDVNNGTGQGSKIMIDRSINNVRSAVSPVVKTTAEFGELIQDIRYLAFDPGYYRHVRDFDLSHPDSWQP